MDKDLSRNNVEDTSNLQQKRIVIEATSHQSKLWSIIRPWEQIKANDAASVAKNPHNYKATYEQVKTNCWTQKKWKNLLAIVALQMKK